MRPVSLGHCNRSDVSTYLLDGFGIDSHPPRGFFTKPLRLRGIKTVFEFEAISAFHVESLPIHVLGRHDAQDDFCNRLCGLPKEACVFEGLDDGCCHWRVRHSRTDSIDSDAVSLVESLACGA